MSVTKDTATGKWMSQLRVTDWQGKTIHKKKRGFLTKKEAQEWEFDFITQCRRAPENIGLTFADFVKVYLADMEYRLKPSTKRHSAATTRPYLRAICDTQKSSSAHSSEMFSAAVWCSNAPYPRREALPSYSPLPYVTVSHCRIVIADRRMRVI